MTRTEQVENAIDLVSGETRVRSGFRVAAASQLAGGPIELEFFVELGGDGSRHLLIASDRTRYRSADFLFAATFDNVPLVDPFANVPYMGGPAGVVEIAESRPWRQSLVLNEFVGLEAAPDLLEPGGSGLLIVDCSRPLRLSLDKQAALSDRSTAPLVEVQLTVQLHRDDAKLGALVEQLMTEVLNGPPEQRERPLRFLLALRMPAAVDRWRTLVNHPDPLVFERVRQCLWSSGL